MEDLFFDTAEEAMKHYWETDKEWFKIASEYRERDRLGIAHPLGNGSCTSHNCFGTTGCTATTENGYCACGGPNGPCGWVPGV